MAARMSASQFPIGAPKIILYSFGGTTFARLLDNPYVLLGEKNFFKKFFNELFLAVLNIIKFLGEFLSASIGVIVLGALFLLINILISHFQYNTVEDAHGEDPLQGIGG